MPARSPLQVVAFDGFAGGWKPDAASSELAPDELRIANNVMLSARGEARHAGGQVQLDTIRFLRIFEYVYGRRLIGIATTGGIYYSDVMDPTNWSNTMVTTAPYFSSYFAGWGAVEYQAPGTTNSYLYINNYSTIGYDCIRITTSMTVTTVASIQKGKHMLVRNDRMFVAFNDTYQNRLWWSNLGDPETFDAADYLDVGEGEGDWITALATHGDNIIIFKNRSVWQLSGLTPSEFRLYQLTDDIGAASETSVKELNGRIVFFDPYKGVWAFDGSSFEEVSYPIRNWMYQATKTIAANGRGHNEWYDINAEIIDNKYWLCLPENGLGIFTDTEGGCLIWDPVHNSWTSSDIRFEDASVHWKPTQQTVLSSETYSWEYDRDSRNGPENTNLELDIATGWVRMGGAGSRGRVRRVELIVEAGEGETFTVEMYKDYDEAAAYLTRSVTIDGDLTASHFEVALSGWGTKGISFSFRVKSTTASIRIARIAVFYTTTPDIGGEHGL